MSMKIILALGSIHFDWPKYANMQRMLSITFWRNNKIN